MTILLSDEEIYRAYLDKPDIEDKLATPMAEIFIQDSDRRIARAQLKNVVEWGEEICTEHWGKVKSRTPTRWRCPECQEALKKEAGL